MDLKTAVKNAKAGDTILLKSGEYKIEYVKGKRSSIVMYEKATKDNPIVMKTDDSKRAIFDFQFPAQEWVQDSVGFALSGEYWHVENIAITRAGYQGIYIQGKYNTIVNCAFYDNRNTGMEINKGGSYNTVINCDSFRNYDPKKKGQSADGFAPKQEQGPGNKFIGCRSWENSDDGYDCYDSPEAVIFENCWAFRNGVDVWHYGGFDGNGNGFKVGGNYKVQNNILINCVSFGHPQKGFDQNNNRGGVTLYNCTAFGNGINYGFFGKLDDGQKHVVKNCINVNGKAIVKNAEEASNSWSEGFSAEESDFVSIDLKLAESERNADGSLKETGLFRLKPSSKLVDAGVNVGLSYKGKAPDIGAFETGK